ncbi:Endogenous retrovirus group 3 member 1 Env polyprotein [Plecturocebus cupreus]
MSQCRSFQKKTKNLFLQLAENMAHSLNVTSCYVCEGTTMGDRWLWEARELVPSDPVPDLTSVQRIQTKSFWVLKFSIIGQYYLAREGKVFTVPVGKLSCLGQQLCNGTVDTITWWSSNYTEKNPLLKFPRLQDALNHPGDWRDWIVPAGLAYIQLPERWSGSCVIGIIKPFFLLSVKTGELLGYLVYSIQEKISIKIHEWKNDKCPSERIIEYYGQPYRQKMAYGDTRLLFTCSIRSSSCSLFWKYSLIKWENSVHFGLTRNSNEKWDLSELVGLKLFASS